MKKFVKILNKMLAACLVASMIIGLMPATYAVATEMDDPSYDGFAEPVYEEPFIEDEYNYLDSNGQLSFGQLKVDDYVYYQQALFINNGKLPHYFTVSISPADMWDVDIPENAVINPNDIYSIYIRPKLSSPKWTVGEHTAVLTMNGYSASSGSVSDTVSVNLYVTIYEPSKPWVSSVSVSPGSVSLSRSSNYTFRASVDCGDGASSEVKWNCSGQTSNSTYVDPNGTLYVGNDENASNITVTATSVEDSSKSGSATVNVSKNQFTINTQANPVYGGSTAGGGVYDDGATATVVANPSNGYTFAGWYDANNNKVSSDARYMFTVKNSQVLTARFTQNSLRVNTKKNLDKAGNISSGATIMYGGSYTAKATVNDGYRFVGWYEGNNLISNGTEVTLNGITSNRELTAVYEQSSYVVVAVVDPANMGTVTGAGKYNKGSNVTLTANPVKGYSFVAWIYNNQNIGTDKTLKIKNLDKDYSITAFFKKDDEKVKTYTIGASTDTGNGNITPSGVTTVIEGKPLVLSIVPNTNYKIADVKVDGKSVGAVSAYTFYDIKSNHTIVASFAKADSKPAQPVNNSNVVVDDKRKPTTNNNSTPTTTKPTTDNATAVQEACEYTELTGVLQDMNLTVEEARLFIEAKDDRALMEDALYRGDLQVTVVNKFAENPNETSTASYYDITSIPNLEDVIDSILTTEEKLELFQGTKVRTNLNIGGMESSMVPEEELAVFAQHTDGITVDNFFDMRFITEVDGVPALVTSLSEPMKVVMKVSPEMREKGNGKYCVLRVHDGQFDILEDVDDNPDTVTFVTDKMSTFAMAYYNSDNNEIQTGVIDNPAGPTPATTDVKTKSDNAMLVLYIMLAALAIGIAVVMGIAISSSNNSKKKKKHKK